MPIHPRRVRAVITLTISLLLTQATIALAAAPIHLTDNSRRPAAIHLTQVALAPIHVTEAEA